MEPYSVRISKARLLYERLDDLGFKFAGLGRFFSYVGNPYPDIDYGDFSHIKLIMVAWNDELQDDRETWEDDPLVCSMVSEVRDFFRLDHHVPIIMQQKEEERERQRHFEENLGRNVATTREE